MCLTLLRIIFTTKIRNFLVCLYNLGETNPLEIPVNDEISVNDQIEIL